MPDQTGTYREFGSDASIDDVKTWIDLVLDQNGDLEPAGIHVSPELAQQGFVGRYREIPIAMDQDLHFRAAARVVFRA